MTGIRKNTDRLTAKNNLDIIYYRLQQEENVLKALPPELHDIYLKEQEKLTTKLNNMIWYGNEEGQKHE